MGKSRITFYRALFYSGAVFNFLVAIGFALAFDWLYGLSGGGPVPDIPLLQLFIELIALAIFLFGIVYFFAGRWLERPESNLLITLGAVGKIVFFGIVLGYTLAGHTPWGLVALGSVDLVYGLLFLECLLYKSAYAKRQTLAAPVCQ